MAHGYQGGPEPAVRPDPPGAGSGVIPPKPCNTLPDTREPSMSRATLRLECVKCAVQLGVSLGWNDRDIVRFAESLVTFCTKPEPTS